MTRNAIRFLLVATVAALVCAGPVATVALAKQNVSLEEQVAGVLQVKIYTDGTDTYMCKARPGTPLTAADWQVRKIDVNGNTTWADGNAEFDNVATDAATVKALTYQ